MTKTDKGWKNLFDKYDIADKIDKYGHFVITSTEINQFREARLMTKFDHRKNLPVLFQKYNLSILPITRGSYIISKFDAYKNLEYDGDIETIEITFPTEIESIDVNNIYSEATALNCAYTTGMINHFLEEEITFPTVSGRMSSSDFSFHIRNVENNKNFLVDVSNSQVEIDGGYEGRSRLMLVEAKNSVSSDFLIRQLYYPYRLWENKISKEVVPVFMTYSNDIFSFFEFKFENPMEYNSLVLVKQKNYIIAPDRIVLDDIYKVFKDIKVIQEPQVSYPQADSFERVINLLEMLMEDDRDKDYLTHTLDVHHRQTNYYTSAGMYLGLIEKRAEDGLIIYYLSDEGKRIMKLKYKQKYLAIAEKILQNPSFNKAFSLYLQQGYPPSRDEIVEIMKEFDVYNVDSESTYYRRASTVRCWLDWILGLQS